MIVYKLIVKYQTIVLVTETSSKMASILCQKLLSIFLSKSIRFSTAIQFCSNFTNMWPKHLPNNVWRDFRLPISALAMIT